MTIFRRRESGQAANLLKLSKTTGGKTTDLTFDITDIETMLGPVGMWRLEKKSAVWAGNLRRELGRMSRCDDETHNYRVRVAITRTKSVPLDIFTNNTTPFDLLRPVVMRLIGVPLVKLVEEAQNDETIRTWFEEWVLENAFDGVDEQDAERIADFMARQMRSTPELTQEEWDQVVAEADELPSSTDVFSLFEKPVGGYPEVAWFADTQKGRLV